MRRFNRHACDGTQRESCAQMSMERALRARGRSQTRRTPPNVVTRKSRALPTDPEKDDPASKHFAIWGIQV